MKKIKVISILLIMIIIIGFLVNSVYAYLSSKVEASGSIKCNIGIGHPNMKITKTAEDERKITITNDGDYDCYVRFKAIAVDDIHLEYSYEDDENGRKWILESDGYYYYESVLLPNETSGAMILTLRNYSDKNYNVAFIAEATNAMHDGGQNESSYWDAKFEYGNNLEGGK